MKMFSLRTIIDDILLIVRNNNISESEDLSRAQIASWVIQYRAYLAKKQAEQDEQTGDDTEPSDTIDSTTIGPLELEDWNNSAEDDCCGYMFKKTKEKVLTTEDSESDVISVYDQNYCPIQYMYNQRKHFHRFRRYTYNEPTCWFDNGYIYIEGSNLDNIESIYVTGNIDPEGYADGEDDVTIPGWMIPDIKKAIMTNELAFMLKRPSDDSNNSTLSSVKPNGPQDKEK